MWRRVSAISLTLALSCLCFVAVDGAQAAPTDATQTASTRLPYELTIRGNNGRAQTSASLPDASIPVRFEATIKSTYQREGSIIVTVGGRRAATVPAQKGGVVAFDLLPSDVSNNLVEIGMVAQLAWVEDCFADDNDEAVLSDSQLSYRYDTAPPTTIGNFLSAGVNSYTVIVPAAPSSAEQSAGLTAVSSLATRYQPPTNISILASGTPPATTFLDRQVLIQDAPLPAGTNSEMSIDKEGRLVIRGNATGLNDAAVALASNNTQVLDAATASNVTSSVDFSMRDGSVTLADLGTAPVSLVGIGQQEAEIAIDQPWFAQQIASFGIRLRGTATQLPAGGQGRVDFTWNGDLVGSQELSEKTALAQDLAISPAMMQRQNTLGVVLSYSPPGTKCAPPGIPARVDLDLVSSTVDATVGTSVPAGFNQLPQSLPQAVPVAFGTNGSTPTLLRQAGYLVGSLSQGWPQQRTYTVQSTDTVLQGKESGIVVGATNQMTQDLAAPLRTGVSFDLGTTSTTFGATVTEPMAYVQTFTNNGRVLTLLGYNDTDAAKSEASAVIADKLAAYVYQNPNGWRALPGQVVVSNSAGVATPVDLVQVVPDKGKIWLIATGIGFLIVLLILLGLLWLRPRRRSAQS